MDQHEVQLHQSPGLKTNNNGDVIYNSIYASRCHIDHPPCRQTSNGFAPDNHKSNIPISRSYPKRRLPIVNLPLTIQYASRCHRDLPPSRQTSN